MSYTMYYGIKTIKYSNHICNRTTTHNPSSTTPNKLHRNSESKPVPGRHALPSGHTTGAIVNGWVHTWSPTVSVKPPLWPPCPAAAQTCDFSAHSVRSPKYCILLWLWWWWFDCAPWMGFARVPGHYTLHNVHSWDEQSRKHNGTIR